jgi:ABC-2 type transport system permease protein
MNALSFNRHGVWAIYRFEMARFLRTILQSVLTPVITTALFVVVFGAAIGSRMSEVDGVSYGVFIVPGLIMLSLFTESISNASFGIHFPKFTGTIFEILSAPVAAWEIVLGYVGAAATKSVLLGLIILATASFFVPITIQHPLWMIAFMVLTAITFSLFGFIIGIWAKNWEQMQLIPMLIVTPLTFLGGAFYSIAMLPPAWQTVTLFNPVVYLISGFRWSFFGKSDVGVELSLGMTLVFLLLCLGAIAWIFRTGYRLKN